MVARLCLILLLACSSNKKRVADDATAARADSPPPADAAVAADAPPATDAKTGDLQIRVEWKDVPVAMRASPGRTACKTPRAPVVAPTTTWGIPDVLVVIDGATLPVSTPRIVLSDCTLAPRVVAGTDVTIESAVDRPAKLTLAKRGELATLATLADKPATRTILLPIAGHAVKPALDANGIYELAIDGETAWIAAAPNAAVTEANGQLTVRDLAPGTYAVTAWLPPRAGGAAKRVTGSAKVVAGDLAELVLELK